MRLALLAAALMVMPTPPGALGGQVTAGAPTAQPPRAHLLEPGTLSTVAVPLKVSWPAATAHGSPIDRYRLEHSLDDGPWSAVALPSRLARSVVVKLRPWQTIRFRVGAADRSGQQSEWATAPALWLAVAQEDEQGLSLSPGWLSVAHRRAFGGGRATTAAADESAIFTFDGREVGWVAQRGPGRGRADVYLDGSLAATVDLYRSSNAQRRIVFRAAWPTVGTHTLEIRTQATAGRPIVDIDAFAVLTDPATETLVGAGDIASCARADDSDTAALVSGIAGIVFTAGDNVYPDGSAQYFDDCYTPTWGAFKERTRPAPGNHDFYNNPGAEAYFAYFGANAGPPGRGYYSFEAGAWRVYSLNSECAPDSSCYGAQYDWLTQDLAAAPHRCVMAIWHRPRFSSGAGHGSSTRMAPFFQLLHDNGAELVISGHEHSYERFAPADPSGAADPTGGVRQFVVGTGGVTLYGLATALPTSEVRDATSQGVLKLDLAPGSYSWQFVPADSDTFTDSGSANCH